MDKEGVITEIDLAQINAIVSEHSHQKWALIALLQKIQGELGYIPPQSIPLIARSLGLFPSQVQGVITFYAQLYTQPRGRKVVRVCRGTACHVRGAKRNLEHLEQTLRIKRQNISAMLQVFSHINCDFASNRR